MWKLLILALCEAQTDRQTSQPTTQWALGSETLSQKIQWDGTGDARYWKVYTALPGDLSSLPEATLGGSPITPDGEVSCLWPLSLQAPELTCTPDSHINIIKNKRNKNLKSMKCLGPEQQPRKGTLDLPPHRQPCAPAQTCAYVHTRRGGKRSNCAVPLSSFDSVLGLSLVCKSSIWFPALPFLPLDFQLNLGSLPPCSISGHYWCILM